MSQSLWYHNTTTMTNQQVSCNNANRQTQSIARNLNDPTKGDSLLSLLATSRMTILQSSRASPREIAASIEGSLSSMFDLDDTVPKEQDYNSRADWMRAIIDASLEDIDAAEIWM
mmetsp:Transcript_12644/g.25611  ORF Transcript_12644/g.25611 Transcript_12644/m.25611 type:complete len:115 (+) Transcript_12644:38-382(+)